MLEKYLDRSSLCETCQRSRKKWMMSLEPVIELHLAVPVDSLPSKLKLDQLVIMCAMSVYRARMQVFEVFLEGLLTVCMYLIILHVSLPTQSNAF